MNTYREAMAFVEERQKAGIRYDLSRMERLMEELRHPERKVKTIHVAGTNGKGSTVTFLRSILQETGLFIGTYMTPVPGDYRHQMAVNGKSMTEEEFRTILAEIAPVVETVEKEMGELVSEFELITALAFYYFSFKSPVDIAVIETGMGGRHDATNVIIPLASVITNVSLDHQSFLGNTREEIAREKAGIIKPGVAAMTACDEEILPVFQKEAKEKKATLYHLADRVKVETFVEEGIQKLTYHAPYRQLDEVPLGMLGNHQGENAALAVMTLDYLRQFYAVMVDDEHVIAGLAKAKLPGRSETLQTNPTIILDTAHNPAAMAVTIQSLKAYNGQDKEMHILFSAMKDKEYETMLRQLQDLSTEIYVTTFSSNRAISLDDIQQTEGIQVISNPQEWIKDWKESNENAILLITGSNQFVGEIREAIF